MPAWQAGQVRGGDVSGLRELPRAAVGPVSLRVVPFDRAATAVLATATSLERPAPARPGVAVHFVNAYSLALADTDPGYAAILDDPGSVALTDGVPVAWAGRRLHPHLAPGWDRVYGPDVFEAVMAASGPDTPGHYLLGGSPDVLASLADQVGRRWPRARIMGMHSPPFRALDPGELARQDERIRESGAKLVWVGLGTPKQDHEVARLAGELPVVALGVGAAFDFLSGHKPQAPLWMQRSGTEWAFRLASEPRRLARRYLWGNPRFVWATLKGARRQRGGTTDAQRPG